jgi:hypothetical protein
MDLAAMVDCEIVLVLRVCADLGAKVWIYHYGGGGCDECR